MLILQVPCVLLELQPGHPFISPLCSPPLHLAHSLVGHGNSTQASLSAPALPPPTNPVQSSRRTRPIAQIPSCSIAVANQPYRAPADRALGGPPSPGSGCTHLPAGPRRDTLFPSLPSPSRCPSSPLRSLPQPTIHPLLIHISAPSLWEVFLDRVPVPGTWSCLVLHEQTPAPPANG